MSCFQAFMSNRLKGRTIGFVEDPCTIGIIAIAIRPARPNFRLAGRHASEAHIAETTGSHDGWLAENYYTEEKNYNHHCP